jgi:hypothetical protein
LRLSVRRLIWPCMCDGENNSDALLQFGGQFGYPKHVTYLITEHVVHGPIIGLRREGGGGLLSQILSRGVHHRAGHSPASQAAQPCVLNEMESMPAKGTFSVASTEIGSAGGFRIAEIPTP